MKLKAMRKRIGPSKAIDQRMMRTLREIHVLMFPNDKEHFDRLVQYVDRGRWFRDFNAFDWALLKRAVDIAKCDGAWVSPTFAERVVGQYNKHMKDLPCEPEQERT